MLSKLEKFQVNWTNGFWVIVSAVSKKMVSRKNKFKDLQSRYIQIIQLTVNQRFHDHTCPLFFLAKLVVYVINTKKRKIRFFVPSRVEYPLNNKTRTVFNFENFTWGLCYWSLSTIDLNCFKNRLGTSGFAYWKFFFKSYPERFFVSWKKTIALFLVKKFETIMVIFTSERKCVFFKKKILCVTGALTRFFATVTSSAM